MSDAPPPVQPPAAVHPVLGSFERYSSPSVGMAFYLVTIGAAVEYGIYQKGSPELFAASAMFLLGVSIGAISQFIYGSSKGSQDKTAAATPPANLPPEP